MNNERLKLRREKKEGNRIKVLFLKRHKGTKAQRHGGTEAQRHRVTEKRLKGW
jgi:hypothetical protein